MNTTSLIAQLARPNQRGKMLPLKTDQRLDTNMNQLIEQVRALARERDWERAASTKG